MFVSASSQSRAQCNDRRCSEGKSNTNCTNSLFGVVIRPGRNGGDEYCLCLSLSSFFSSFFFLLRFLTRLCHDEAPMTFCSTFSFVGFASIFLRTALCNVIMICVASETVELLSVGLSVSAYQPVFLSLSPSSLSAFKPHFLSLLSPVKQQRFARNIFF